LIVSNDSSKDTEELRYWKTEGFILTV
jgi:hypothetical protein